jgi:transcriptional regulator with XRE-family HTH domain
MILIYYSLFQKYFWHCYECLSSAEDISYSNLLKKSSTYFSNIESKQVIKNRISNNMRRIIKEKGMSYTKVSKILNTKRSTLSYQLSPRNNPSISTIIKIGNVLNVDFRRFFNDYKINRGINEREFVIESPKKILSILSVNILYILKQKNMSKTQLANKLGIHKTNLGYKISSKNNPRLNTLIDLSKALEVDDLSVFFNKIN